MLIHITGASGSGTSTLGRALAAELGGKFLDTDDYFWMPSDPPYQKRRSEQERVEMLLSDLPTAGATVVSGSVSGWGSKIEDAFDYVIFLYLDVAIRLERLQKREVERFGKVNPAFLEWAGQYDDGPPEGRSMAKQRAWLSARSCPVLRLEEDLSTQARLAQIRQWMSQHRA